MSDRTPHTDALATLGMIHDKQEHRDAIHLGVEPVVAGEILCPGEHIGLATDGRAYRADVAMKALGIVDPFLNTNAEPGDRFWLIVYPRQITSLRHVWEHPDFPDSGETHLAQPAPAEPTHGMEASERWLRDFIARSDCPGYDTVIAAALSHPGSTWDDDYLHFRGYDAHGEIPEEFWHHLYVVTGVQVSRPAKYFSCSC